mgnify:CR=1 FL=1
MCKLDAGGHIIAGDECCGDDPDDCALSTVEGDMLRDACADVIHLVNNIRELVDEVEGAGEELNERLFESACLSLTIGVGDLVGQVVQYIEPDAGLEPI